MTLQSFLELLISAILLAGLYATMSYGLALIYGVMKIINLAHAGVMMLGAYMTYWLVTTFNVNPFLTPLLVVPIFFLLGLAMQRILIRPIAGAPMISSLLLLFGVWLILQNIVYVIFSGDPKSIPPRFIQFAPLVIADIRISTIRLIIFFISIVALVVLQLFLSRTSPGRAIRAVAADSEASLLVGINTERINMLAFGLGISLASLAGSLMSLVFTFDPEFFRSPLLKSFSIVVLGGLESFVGVMLGSLVLAVTEALSVGVFQMKAAMQDFVSFALLVVVLIVMPNGLVSLFKRKT